VISTILSPVRILQLSLSFLTFQKQLALLILFSLCSIDKDQEQFTKQLFYYLCAFAGGIPVSFPHAPPSVSNLNE